MISKFTHLIKGTYIVFCLVLFIMIPISIQAQSKIKSINTLEDKIYGLSLLWSEVKYNFLSSTYKCNFLGADNKQ